jgi:hypothetical protein
MPVRTASVKVMTPVQGADAYIVMRKPTFREIKQLSEMKDNPDGNLLPKLLAGIVLEWNWVDGSGAPLPAPTVDSILDLPMDEVASLADAIRESIAAPKTSASGSQVF